MIEFGNVHSPSFPPFQRPAGLKVSKGAVHVTLKCFTETGSVVSGVTTTPLKDQFIELSFPAEFAKYTMQYSNQQNTVKRRLS